MYQTNFIVREPLLDPKQRAIDYELSWRAGMASSGPYLALAEACELNHNLVSSLATSQNIRPIEVNKAHLSAPAWAQNITT